jgi:hypothetical protein
LAVDAVSPHDVPVLLQLSDGALEGLLNGEHLSAEVCDLSLQQRDAQAVAWNPLDNPRDATIVNFDMIFLHPCPFGQRLSR